MISSLRVGPYIHALVCVDSEGIGKAVVAIQRQHPLVDMPRADEHVGRRCPRDSSCYQPTCRVLRLCGSLSLSIRYLVLGSRQSCRGVKSRPGSKSQKESGPGESPRAPGRHPKKESRMSLRSRKAGGLRLAESPGDSFQTLSLGVGREAREIFPDQTLF